MYIFNWKFLELKMLVAHLVTVNQMHQAASLSERFCGGYWAEITTPSNLKDPINSASSYKESGN
jgi:hypothetical protein